MLFKLYSNQDPHKVLILYWLIPALNSFYCEDFPYPPPRHPLRLRGSRRWSPVLRSVPCSGRGGRCLGCR